MELTLAELEDCVVKAGASKFHARQIFSWIYRKGARDFGAMSDLPVELRQYLAQEFTLSGADVRTVLTSTDGTRKLLLALTDGELIEAVVIPAAGRTTGCVSTQAGCRFACSFCASGRAGFKRNLSVGEILQEVLLLKHYAPERRLTHLVFMGTGEPLDNYDNVMKAVRLINAPYAVGIGARRITISTCGIIPGIERLMKEGLQIELSVSLHAPDDELRTRLVPVNRKYPLKDLISVCRVYAKTTKRQVTFEYILLRGVNSDLQSARKLGKLMQGFDSKVNLIPCNPAAEAGIEPPEKQEIAIFRDALKKYGIPVTVRAARGQDINAACGQLRLHYEKR